MVGKNTLVYFFIFFLRSASRTSLSLRQHSITSIHCKMAAPRTALPVIKLPTGPSPTTPEQRYWKTFRSQQLIPSPTNYPITHISFPPPPTNPLLPSTNDYFCAT